MFGKYSAKTFKNAFSAGFYGHLMRDVSKEAKKAETGILCGIWSKKGKKHSNGHLVRDLSKES